MPSNSVSNSEPEDLFRLIAEGGANFTARVTAYTKAKEEYDKAFAALQLGRVTKNLRQEAENTKAEAERLLAEARSKADALVSEAMGKAEGILKHATDRRDAALADADAAAKRHTELVARAQNDAARIRNEADQRLAEVNRLGANVDKRARDLAAAQSAAEQSKRQAEETKATFLKKHLDLSTFLAKMG